MQSTGNSLFEFRFVVKVHTQRNGTFGFQLSTASGKLLAPAFALRNRMLIPSLEFIIIKDGGYF